MSANITYRTIDPDAMRVVDQGMYNPRIPADRSHFNRISRQAHARGYMIMTMETGRQKAMFDVNAAEATELMTGDMT